GLSQVNEWKPLQLSGMHAAGFLGTLGCIFLFTIVRRTELLLHELLALALGIWLAASHQRMLFVFGILAAPILSRLLAVLWDGYTPEHDHPLPNAMLITLSLIVSFRAFPDRQNLTRQV